LNGFIFIVIFLLSKCISLLFLKETAHTS